MRLDRFITLNLVRPLRAVFTHHESRVRSLPILMYHSISEDRELNVAPYYRTCASPRRFAEQMAWLKTLGYAGVTVTDGLAWLNSSAIPSPPRSGTTAAWEAAAGIRPVEGPSGRASGCERVIGQGEVSRPASSGLKSEIRNPQSAIRNPPPAAPSSPGASQPGICNPQSANRNPSCIGEAAPSSRTEPGTWDSEPGTSTRPVAITFDDGFQDFYTQAAPVLKAHGFSATMYLPTAFISDRASRITHHAAVSCPRPFLGKQFLSWHQVQELHAAGIEFGSHTVSHPVLYDLSWNTIQSEIANSKTEIEQRLGVPCTTFAYPYAFPRQDQAFVGRLEDLLRTVGFTTAATTRIGRLRPMPSHFFLPRLPANSDDDHVLLAAKLNGNYDWLGPAQLLSKKLRGRRQKVEPSNLVPVEDRLSSIEH